MLICMDCIDVISSLSRVIPSYVHVRVLLYIVLYNSSICVINHCIVTAYASMHYKKRVR